MIIHFRPKDGQVVVLFGDLNGNNIDLIDHTYEPEVLDGFVRKQTTFFINVMQRLKMPQAQFFFAIDESNQPVLVDIQVATDKLVGPGMIKDLFGQTYPTQQVLKIEMLDDRAIECISNGTGSYSGDLIIKPSKFRLYHDPAKNTYQPMYFEITR
jgi:hypothetical protein